MSRIRLWGPPALVAATIYVLSSMSQVPGGEYVWDKVGHLVVFGALALLTLRAAHGGARPLALGPTALTAALVVAWGVLDEIHQRFVPGRHASVLDVVADAAGAALAIGLWARRLGRAGKSAARIARAPVAPRGEG